MTKVGRLVTAALALALLSTACGNEGGGQGGLSGAINADGSSTVFPITQAVAEEFQAENQSGTAATFGTTTAPSSWGTRTGAS